MKYVSCVVFSMCFLSSTSVFSGEGGLWAVVTGWPGCIAGTVASCCCLKRCCMRRQKIKSEDEIRQDNERSERVRKEEIERKYNERSFIKKVGEFCGTLKYDHSTGDWYGRNWVNAYDHHGRVRYSYMSEWRRVND